MRNKNGSKTVGNGRFAGKKGCCARDPGEQGDFLWDERLQRVVDLISRSFYGHDRIQCVQTGASARLIKIQIKS